MLPFLFDVVERFATLETRQVAAVGSRRSQIVRQYHFPRPMARLVLVELFDVFLLHRLIVEEELTRHASLQLKKLFRPTMRLKSPEIGKNSGIGGVSGCASVLGFIMQAPFILRPEVGLALEAGERFEKGGRTTSFLQCRRLIHGYPEFQLMHALVVLQFRSGRGERLSTLDARQIGLAGMGWLEIRGQDERGFVRRTIVFDAVVVLLDEGIQEEESAAQTATFRDEIFGALRRIHGGRIEGIGGLR